MAKFIILDANTGLVEIVKYAIELQRVAEVLPVTSVAQMKEALEQSTDVLCVVVDSYLALGHWSPLAEALNSHSKLHVIFCGDPFANKFVAELSRQIKIPVAGYVEKPHVIEPLMSLLKAMGKRAGGIESQTESYICVSKQVLSTVARAPVDLFVKVSPQMHVQVLPAGGSLASITVNAWRTPGDGCFYVRSQDGEKLFSIFESWLQSLRKRSAEFKPVSDFPLSVSAMRTLHGLFKKEFWMSTEVQNLTHQTISTVMAQLESESRVAPFLRLLREKQDSYIASHSMVLAYLSCAFSQSLGWDSEFTLRKLALASVLHDIVLDGDDLARVRTIGGLAELRMEGREADAHAVELHPLAVAELVRSMKEYPPGLDQLIAQHHDLPDGMGFPDMSGTQKIEPLSALFILLHDFVARVIGSGDRETYQQVMKEMASEYQGLGLYEPLLMALRGMLEASESVEV